MSKKRTAPVTVSENVENEACQQTAKKIKKSAVDEGTSQVDNELQASSSREITEEEVEEVEPVPAPGISNEADLAKEVQNSLKNTALGAAFVQWMEDKLAKGESLIREDAPDHPLFGGEDDDEDSTDSSSQESSSEDSSGMSSGDDDSGDSGSEDRDESSGEKEESSDNNSD